ncbi:aminomethyl transferase family protein [Microbacterium immunditiarum]|uniref:Vanillate/3-O-methylgallate O-demethylase n=1 Tax=Microbacterium immunditiarum TaxID=337480 RepID=A0A7Y9GKR4_9MICO|nr:aminomethyl transferase family protein [Microbacterium immunditiarum]NYE18286.1 vanillate/3-O-methylgallate O-demethylase [Microbacterium immunditiarum]
MSTDAAVTSLQDLIDRTPDLVDYLYNDSPGAHSRLRPDLTPVRQEITNWRDEQRSWRESAILFDQSHHMPELLVSGPDAKRLLSHIGVNSLANLEPGRAKQFIGVNPRGQMIGDCILYDLGEGVYELVSSTPLLNWIQFNVETGDWDVTLERDDNTSDNPTGRRKRFRYQLDGPNAAVIFDEIVEGGAPEIGFFRTARVRIAGVDVMVLRHSMSGHKGYEISGPFDRGDTVRGAIVEAGAEHGLLQAGAKTYFSASFEGGWMAYPLPAIYTGDDLRAYREWLPATSWEAKFQLAGSFKPSSIEEYYVTPYDLGYGKLVSFDHDFIGREALEEIAKHPRRTKVTLVWDKDDVLRIWESLLEPGVPFKFLDLPVADYGNLMHRDEVRDAEGAVIGLATKTGYSINERKILSLAMLDVDRANIGDEVEIVWGEPDGGSRKPQVELHRQTVVRATVAPAPYAALLGAARTA